MMNPQTKPAKSSNEVKPQTSEERAKEAKRVADEAAKSGDKKTGSKCC